MAHLLLGRILASVPLSLYEALSASLLSLSHSLSFSTSFSLSLSFILPLSPSLSHSYAFCNISQVLTSLFLFLFLSPSSLSPSLIFSLTPIQR